MDVGFQRLSSPSHISEGVALKTWPLQSAFLQIFLTSSFFSPNPLCFVNLFFIEVQLIYNAVLVSGVQQSASVIHIFIHSFKIFFSGMAYQKVLNLVPCGIQ